ncbi:eukaryotic translation initiation factor 3 subunit G-like [Lotus japonicus]|uniref:eukaryotic translation initiation factor 3 subunit G-like n=1 Tax=Lotus japonicus TaxID=34305 RepID=UPI0025897364|nr:eukaryotic translation initiation factor 3 subunit G-like [Lotus japonicus]
MKKVRSARVSSSLSSKATSSSFSGRGGASDFGVCGGDEEEEDGGADGERLDGGDGSKSPCFSLFIDGISEAVGYHQVRNLFLKHGKVKSIFIQRQQKVGRRFRFGFVRYILKEDTFAAMKRLDSFRIGGAFLFVPS